MKTNELRNLIKKEVKSILKESITNPSQISSQTDIEELRAYVEKCLAETEKKINDATQGVTLKVVKKTLSAGKDYNGVQEMPVKQINLQRIGMSASKVKLMMRNYWNLSEAFNQVLHTKFGQGYKPADQYRAIENLIRILTYLGF